MPLSPQPLTLEIVGPFPTIYRLCRGCLLPDDGGRQLGEYPREVRACQEAAVQLASALVSRLGPAVRLRVVDLASPRGLWLALRHRLRHEPAVVVAGRVVRSLDPDTVLGAIDAR